MEYDATIPCAKRLKISSISKLGTNLKTLRFLRITLVRQFAQDKLMSVCHSAKFLIIESQTSLSGVGSN